MDRLSVSVHSLYFSFVLSIDNAEGLFSLDTANWWLGQGNFLQESPTNIDIAAGYYFEKSQSKDKKTEGESGSFGFIQFTAPASVSRIWTQRYITRKRNPGDVVIFSTDGVSGQISELASGAVSAGVDNSAQVGFSVTKLVGSIKTYLFNYEYDGRPPL